MGDLRLEVLQLSPGLLLWGSSGRLVQWYQETNGRKLSWKLPQTEDSYKFRKLKALNMQYSCGLSQSDNELSFCRVHSIPSFPHH